MASNEDAKNAIQAGADAIGFVCAIPTSPRTIDIDAVASIASQATTGVETFLLTSESTAERIAQKVLAAGVYTVPILSDLSHTETEQ